MFRGKRSSALLGALRFNSNICLTPHGLFVSFAGNTSELVGRVQTIVFTRDAVALPSTSANPDIAAPGAHGRSAVMGSKQSRKPSGRVCGRVPWPSGIRSA